MLTETLRAGEFLMHEANGSISREKVTFAATTVAIAAGQIIACLMALTGAADEGNTGDGALTVGAIGANVQAGVYTLTCTAAATDAGTFSVQAPDGTMLPPATVAVAYAGSHVGFTIADGAADFIVGDVFTITVAEGNYEPYDAAGTDGTQIAKGVLYAPLPIDTGTQPGVIIARHAEVDGSLLTGSDAAALAALATRNIIVR